MGFSIKKFVPTYLKKKAGPLMFRINFRKLEHNWARTVKHLNPTTRSAGLRSILIVPSDARTLVGSLGDDAMITATEQMARKRNPDVEIHVLIDGAPAQELAKARGYVPNDIWSLPDFTDRFASLIAESRIDAVAILGADVMDGYYGGWSPSRLIAAADIATRSGAATTILGFSFNNSPVPELARAFGKVDARTKINLRDELSLGRFQRFSGGRGTLVADAAFSLSASSVDGETQQWVADRRAEGKKVIGFNLHPMLFKQATESQIERIIAQGVAALRSVTKHRKVAWLLLPHDYREGVGDDRCLLPIYSQLKSELGSDLRHFAGRHRATELKAVAGLMDGVVSGRMHLAIASLGMGVPTLCITYQDKFEGLYRHFALPEWLLVDSSALNETEGLTGPVLQFVDELETIKAQIASSRLAVLERSRENFSVFG